MTRLLALLLAGLAAGCAFQDGDPWGRVEMTLTAGFAPDASRLTPEGWLRTSTDYAIELRVLRVEIGEVELAVGAQSSGPLSFDPANPPPGYSLCHNGHCHADDGSLPTYEEIDALLNGTDGAAQPVLVAEVDRVASLEVEPRAVELGVCAGCTLLEPTALNRSTLHLHTLELEATVRDLRGEAQRRLPAEGLDVRGVIEIDVDLSTPIDVAFGRDEPVGARLVHAVSMTPALFDDVDWAALTPPSDGALDLSSDAAVGEAIATAIREHDSLTVVVERFD